jgi:uncharacterized membrane protein
LPPPSLKSDRDIETIMGGLLRAGVVIAAIFVLMGGALYLWQAGFKSPEYSIFKGEPATLRAVPGVIKQLLTLHSRGIVQFGILLLIATPVARVLFSIVAFFLERDWLYVVITLFVFCVLLFSLFFNRF